MRMLIVLAKKGRTQRLPSPCKPFSKYVYSATVHVVVTYILIYPVVGVFLHGSETLLDTVPSKEVSSCVQYFLRRSFQIHRLVVCVGGNCVSLLICDYIVILDDFSIKPPWID